MIRNISEAEGFLSKMYARASEVTGKDVTVGRMWPLLECVGNPHKKLKIIHVAGTSGKTSTSYYIDALLRETGIKTGLTVSPHIQSITERLQLGGNPVSEGMFCKYLSTFIEAIGQDPDATYFEFMIVFVLWVFAQESVDYAVIETGLGGLHDATNVCRREDKVCVITDIGYDHQHILGSSLEEISFQKAGIIHPGNHVFMYRQGSRVMSVIEEVVRDKRATLHDVSRVQDSESELPLYQQRNWELAHSVVAYIAARDMLQPLSKARLERTKISVIGRMYKIVKGNKIYILDGAHNQQKMAAFVESFQLMYPSQKANVILAMKKDKDYQDAIQLLSPIAAKIYCCRFQTAQDFIHTSVDPEMLRAAAEYNGIMAIIPKSLDEAIRLTSKDKEPLTIVTGSLYVLGDAIAKL